jgi:hypothetical protein
VTCSSGKISLITDASTAFVAGANFDGLSMTRLPAAITVTTGISDWLTGSSTVR